MSRIISPFSFYIWSVLRRQFNLIGLRLCKWQKLQLVLEWDLWLVLPNITRRVSHICCEFFILCVEFRTFCGEFFIQEALTKTISILKDFNNYQNIYTLFQDRRLERTMVMTDNHIILNRSLAKTSHHNIKVRSRCSKTSVRSVDNFRVSYCKLTY